MAAQRKRLDIGPRQSVYSWEEGEARPRAQHLPPIFALQNLGRRQASEIHESRKAA
jgi:hypothetical protein